LSIVSWAALSLGLAGLISFFAEDQRAISYPFVIDRNLKPISSEAKLAGCAVLERIKIGDFSIRDSDPISAQNHLSLDIPNWARNNQGSGFVLTWPKIRSMGRDRALFLYFEMFCVLCPHHGKSTYVADFIGGRLPKIFEFYPNVWTIFGVRMKNADIGDIDVSAQLASYRDPPSTYLNKSGGGEQASNDRERDSGSKERLSIMRQIAGIIREFTIQVSFLLTLFCFLPRRRSTWRRRLDALLRATTLKAGLGLGRAILDSLDGVPARQCPPRSDAPALQDGVRIDEDRADVARHRVSQFYSRFDPVVPEEIGKIIYGQIQQICCPTS